MFIINTHEHFKVVVPNNLIQLITRQNYKNTFLPQFKNYHLHTILKKEMYYYYNKTPCIISNSFFYYRK